MTAAVVNKSARLHILRAGQHFEVSAPLDETVAFNATPTRVDVVGWTATAVVLADSYASVSPGMSLCQAGQERFLRVISLKNEQPTLAFSTKLESCRENIELVAPISLSADARTLSATWLEPHPETHKAELVMHFDDSGSPMAP